MPKEPIPIMPVKDNMVCIPVEKDSTSPGGIVLVSNNKIKDPYRKGIVVAVGPGMTAEQDNGNSQIPETVKPGTIIFYHQAAGWEIPFGENKKYVVVSWRQVEALVNPEYVETLKSKVKED